MISKWKYNYTDEEKGMELTIQNLKQEIDKLVDANEDINREFSQYKYESKKEIERLSNIINEFDKWLDEESEKTILSTGHLTCLMMCKNKLQELKGSSDNG